MKKEKSVEILYTNWQNETRIRKIMPINIEYKKSEWHKKEQWILNAIDLEINEKREFSIETIKEWKEQ